MEWLAVLSGTAEPLHWNRLEREIGYLALQAQDYPVVVLDLRNLAFISSCEIGTLIQFHKQLHCSGRRLRLKNLQPVVREVLSVCKLDTFFTIEEATLGSSPV